MARAICGFTRGESDMLRKAVGKRKTNVLTTLKSRFVEGGVKNGHDKKALEKVWKEIERKGLYAYNKALLYAILGWLIKWPI